MANQRKPIDLATLQAQANADPGFQQQTQDWKNSVHQGLTPRNPGFKGNTKVDLPFELPHDYFANPSTGTIDKTDFLSRNPALLYSLGLALPIAGVALGAGAAGGGIAGAAGGAGAGSTAIPATSLAGGVAGGAGAIAPEVAFGTGAGLASTAIPSLSLAGGVAGGAGAIGPEAAFGIPSAAAAAAPAATSVAAPVANAAKTGTQVASKTGKAGKVLSGMNKAGLDPTMLALGLMSMLGGPDGPKSFSGTTADPVKTLTDALGASKSLMAQIGSRGPARLRSSYVAPPPSPVSLPGIPFQIGGGLGRDPALDNPDLLQGREPMSPLGNVLGNTDIATPRAQATTTPTRRRNP